MSEAVVDPQTEKRNLKLGLILAGFVVVTVIIAIINFYYMGLPKDANRMRERFQQRSAAEAQNLSEALKDSSSTQDESSSTSEETK